MEASALVAPTAGREAVAFRVPVGGASQADLVYHVDGIGEDDPFTVDLEAPGGHALQLFNAGTAAAGYRLSLTSSEPGVDSVVVEYLRDGQPVAASVMYPGSSEPLSAGLAEEPPTSYHYIVVDGKIYIIQDYNGNRADEGGTGTLFITATSERTTVTHVQFTVFGATPVEPDAVLFSGSGPFILVSADF